MIERDQRYARAQPDSPGARRRRGRDYRRRTESVAARVMLAEPYRPKSQFIGELGLVEDMTVVARRITVRFGMIVAQVKQAKFHWTPNSCRYSMTCSLVMMK